MSRKDISLKSEQVKRNKKKKIKIKFVMYLVFSLKTKKY